MQPILPDVNLDIYLENLPRRSSVAWKLGPPTHIRPEYYAHLIDHYTPFQM